MLKVMPLLHPTGGRLAITVAQELIVIISIIVMPVDVRAPIVIIPEVAAIIIARELAGPAVTTDPIIIGPVITARATIDPITAIITIMVGIRHALRIVRHM